MNLYLSKKEFSLYDAANAVLGNFCAHRETPSQWIEVSNELENSFPRGTRSISRDALLSWCLERGTPEDFPLLFPPKSKATKPAESSDCGMSKEALLRVIGGLCILLADKTGKKYRKPGGGLNARALQTDIQTALDSAGLNATGTGKSQIAELLKNEIVQDVLNALNP